jgi:Right handed beta helix region
MASVLIGAPLPALAAQANASCNQSLQAMIDAAPPGSTVDVPACLYRETATIRKPLTVAAQSGAEIRGSDIWTGWAQVGGVWVSDQALPRLPTADNRDKRCGEPTLRCLLPEQVFVDGVPLYPLGVDGAPGSGQFALDRSRHVILADDPSGHVIEVSTRTRWLVTAADNVTIQGFIMRHAANDAQTGAVANDGFSNWTLQDNALADAHGANVGIGYGTNIKVLRNEISGAGNLGLAGYGLNNSLIQGNHLHHNGNDLFNRNWSMGGLKMSEVDTVVVDANESDHNGSGFWCDGGCHNVTFSANRPHDNPLGGIIFEISDGGVFHDNVAWNNGWGPVGWVWGAGIVVSSSANTDIFNNVMAWNAAGISIVDQDRPKPSPPFNHYVHDNTIIRTQLAESDYWANILLAFTSDNGTGPGTLFDPESNNRGANNRYWVDQPEDPHRVARFAWYRGYGSIIDFTSTPGDTGGQYMSSTEKDSVLIAHALPLSPEAHSVGGADS